MRDSEAVRRAVQVKVTTEEGERSYTVYVLDTKRSRTMKRVSIAAEALSIKERTAGNHVQHAMQKIGVDSRTAAAVFAVRHDLD